LSITRTVTRGWRNALLTVLAAGAAAAGAAAAPPETTRDPILPGAKLLHTFPKEVYRVPLLQLTDKGPRLLVCVDGFDPTIPPRFPGEPLKDPQLDLIVWDAAAGKELHKVSYPKEKFLYPPVLPERPRFGSLALSPDGKRLASTWTTFMRMPGQIYHPSTTRVSLIDLESHKAQAGPEYKDEKTPTDVHLVFAPDGALVALRSTKCEIFEAGKDKPRASFDIDRPAGSKTSATIGNMVHTVVPSPDGSRLAVAADGAVIVYDTTTGKKLFEASRAAPEAKTSFGQNATSTALAFAPSPDEQKLLAVEVVMGAPKDFALARLVDLKDKKEVGRWTLAERENNSALGRQMPPPNWGRAFAYFTAKGEPRILFDGKVIDGASGKELQKFDPGAGLLVSPDGKYLVRLTQKKGETKKLGIEVWGLDGEK
jgi:hypothetical protein